MHSIVGSVQPSQISMDPDAVYVKLGDNARIRLVWPVRVTEYRLFLTWKAVGRHYVWAAVRARAANGSHAGASEVVHRDRPAHREQRQRRMRWQLPYHLHEGRISLDQDEAQTAVSC